MDEQHKLTHPFYLTSLFEEIEAMDESAFQPVTPVRPGEKPVGEVGIFCRKLYALSRCMDRQVKHAEVDHEFVPHDESCFAQHALIEELQRKADVLTEIFWATCKAENRSLYAREIDVRRGWVLVIVPPSPPPSHPLFRVLGFNPFNPDNQ